MIKVGIRELKSHLSEYLKRVRNGEDLTITDHGDDVAMIVSMPAAESATMGHLRKLAAQGKAILPTGPKPKGLSRPIKLPASKSASAAIIEDRR